MWILLLSTRPYAVGPFPSFMAAQLYGEKHYPNATREYKQLVGPSEGIDNVIKMPQQSDTPDLAQKSGS